MFEGVLELVIVVELPNYSVTITYFKGFTKFNLALTKILMEPR